MSTKEYNNGEITIIWNPDICKHSGICVKLLPQVYNPKDRPWIKIEHATSQELIHQVNSCPSGALSIKSKFTITRTEDGKKGAFTATENDVQVGLMSYVWAGDDMLIIDHTEVTEGHNGRGVGNELLMAAVYFARANKKRIMPLCPFAKSVFAKKPELADVLK